MEALVLTKGQTLELKKEDGSAISKVRVGLSWDVKAGVTADLDLFVIHKETKNVAYFGNKTAIKGFKLSDDNRTGAGDGDDEFVEADATSSDDGTYVVCLNVYNAGPTFKDIANAKVSVYDSATNAVLATFAITEDGGENNALIVGELKDSGNSYSFTAKGTFLKGDIQQVRDSI
jgi:stress response protein SCP2